MGMIIGVHSPILPQAPGRGAQASRTAIWAPMGLHRDAQRTKIHPEPFLDLKIPPANFPTLLQSDLEPGATLEP